MKNTEIPVAKSLIYKHFFPSRSPDLLDISLDVVFYHEPA
jgi:hypothetical protein